MAVLSSLGEQPIQLVRSHSPEQSVDPSNDVRVGKDVLELITGAMYVEPLTIYREYVQNAADALDLRAQEDGAFDPEIRIALDLANRAIRIRDNGIGVGNRAFVKTLTSIGDSAKRGTGARGFRGIGRLSGLGYCRELVFRSASAGDDYIYEMRWDGVRFRQILRDAAYQGGLEEVVRDVVRTTKRKAHIKESYFEVEMLGVVRVRNDSLLNLDTIRNYLSQVAPVPFTDQFTHAVELEAKLADFGIGRGYRTLIQETGLVESPVEEIFKPYRDEFTASTSRMDYLGSIRFFEIPDLHEGVAAVGWIADHSYLGALPKSELIGGLRVRHGNIQVGAPDIFSSLFPEPRFNSWAVGEVHVLSPSVLPNGRRDNFEENAHYLGVQAHLVPALKEIARTCRQSSARRQWIRRFEVAEKAILDDLERLKNESLSKRQTNDLMGSLTERCLSLIDRSRACRFSDRLEFVKRAERVNATVKRLGVADLAEADPLDAVPYAKRLAFQEVLSLIYEYSVNRDVARKLVSSITRHLAAKHNA